MIFDKEANAFSKPPSTLASRAANVMESDIEKCNQVGMNDHIEKPLDEDEMFFTMAKWIKDNVSFSKIKYYIRILYKAELSQKLPD